MLYLKNGEWALSPFKVKYEQHGEALEQFTHDKQWWIDFAAKWDHTEIIEFEDTSFTVEQKARLEEVKNIDEGFEYYAAQYVLDGTFPDELEDDEERMKNHPLQLLQLEKENTSQGQTITETELESMRHGQKLTDFEIKFMLLEGKA